jgi:hypothetical protein
MLGNDTVRALPESRGLWWGKDRVDDIGGKQAPCRYRKELARGIRNPFPKLTGTYV